MEIWKFNGSTTVAAESLSEAIETFEEWDSHDIDKIEFLFEVDWIQVEYDTSEAPASPDK